MGAKERIVELKVLIQLPFLTYGTDDLKTLPSDFLPQSQLPGAQRMAAAPDAVADIAGASRSKRARAVRTLTVTGLNHALHDGYSDLIYVLLPVWQTEFALGYGLLALLRGLYSGAMAGLQIPAGRIAERIDGKIILMLGTALSALGYVCAGLSGSVLTLSLALALA